MTFITAVVISVSFIIYFSYSSYYKFQFIIIFIYVVIKYAVDNIQESAHASAQQLQELRAQLDSSAALAEQLRAEAG